MYIVPKGYNSWTKGEIAAEENCFRSSHGRSVGSNITEAGDMGCTVL